MFRSNVLCRRVAVALAVAALAPLARGQEKKRKVAALPRDTARAEVVAAHVEPEYEDVVGGTQAMILNAEITPRGRRLHTGQSFSEGVRLAMAEVERVKAEINAASGSQDVRFTEWLCGKLSFTRNTMPVAACRLTRFDSRLELACAEKVRAGRKIKFYLRSVGNAKAKWNVCLLQQDFTARKWDWDLPYAGARRFEETQIEAGLSVPGEPTPPIDVLEFNTYPADRGKRIGVLVEKADYADYKHIFWVKVE